MQAFRSVAFNISTNSIQILVCCGAGIFCFTPLMLHPSENPGASLLKIALTSHQNRDSAVAALALTAPIFMEITTEMIFSFLRRNDAKKANIHTEQELLNWRERLILVCGIITIPIAAFLPPETVNMVNAYLCLRKCRSMLVAGAIIISLCRYDPKIWTVRITYLILLLFAVGTIVGSFSATVIVASNVGEGFFMTGVGAFFICNARWLCSVLPSLNKAMIPSNAVKGISIKVQSTDDMTDLLLQLVYILTITIISLILIATYYMLPGIGLYSPTAMFYNNLAFVFYLLFIMYISERKMKFKVVKTLQSLIESKKMYVRYISHELRTPLNSAFMGLKLVSDDLMASIDDRDFDHFETLLCVKSACRTAVEILNDLLCFDKIESGILELHKHEVPVIHFISDCVNMFSSQSREAGVTIVNTTGCTGSLPRRELNFASSMISHAAMPLPSLTLTDTETTLFNDDIVVMDKFKMDQVLRNLISNAVKFTPRGGYVTVCASFIPNQTKDDDCALRLQPSVVVTGVSTPSPCPATGWTFLSALKSRFSWPLRRRSRVHVSVNGIEDDVEMAIDDLPDTFSQDNAMRGSEDRNSAFNSVASRGSSSSGEDRRLSGDVRSHRKGPDLSEISNSISAPSDVIDSLEKLVQPALTIAGKLRITVTDTGAGISEEDQQRLFKEIVQFNPEVLQAGGGSGLGLCITSSIVQMHAGAIRVYSAGINKGSTFTVEIDMLRRVSSSQPVKVLSRGSAVQTPGETMALDFSKALEYLEYGNGEHAHLPFGDIKTNRSHPILESKSFRQAASDINSGHNHDVYDVLVVDDSGLSRKLLCKLLCASGHTCEEAADGRYSVEKVKARMARGPGLTSSYDVILMDFVMPNMDGPTATEIIRGLGYSGPIFGVTGNALESDVNYFMACGADAVLSKPFDFQLFKDLMTDSKLARHLI